MRILILTFTYSPNADGVSEAATSMARGLAGLGHEVMVATGIVADRTAEAERPVAVHEFAVDGGIHWRKGFIGDVAGYQEFLAAAPVDVLIGHCLDSWPVWCAVPIFARMAYKKILVSHGCSSQLWPIHHRFPWGILAWMRGLAFVARMPFIFRRFDQVVFLSATQNLGRFFDHWLAARFGLKNISVIPNGVEIMAFDKSTLDFRQQYGITTKHLVLCVANYSERKNQELAVRCFLKAGLEDCSLVLIGSQINDYARNVQNLEMRERGTSKSGAVRFLENVPREWVIAAYRAADVFLLTAKAETQPIVLLEAQAARLAFLSTKAGCVKELLGGKVARGLGGLTRQLQRLINEPALRQRLGSEGRAACEKSFSRKVVLSAYDDLINRIVLNSHSEKCIA